MPKVIATANACRYRNPNATIRHYKRKRPSRPEDDCDVLFTCIDNMEGRIKVGRDVKSHPRKLLVDTRIGLTTARIFADTPNFDVWKSSLFPESEMADAPCALRLTHFTALLAAGWAISTLFNYLRDREDFQPVDFIHNLMDFSITHSFQPPKQPTTDYFSGWFPFKELLTDDPHDSLDLPDLVPDNDPAVGLPQPNGEVVIPGFTAPPIPTEQALEEFLSGGSI